MVAPSEPPTQPTLHGLGKRWAVLVGINNYEDKSNYGDLHVCVQDATRVRKTLISGGFETDHVHLLTDQEKRQPSKGEIISQLISVADATDQEDLLLFYFSGHGDEENGESYLIPRDGKGVALYDTALPINRVKKIMEQAKAQAKVIILDACHSGADIRTKGPRRMSEEFFKHVFEEAVGLAILSSCSQRQLSHEWTEKQCSVFTYYLIEALEGSADREDKGFVTVTDVNIHVTQGVKLWASQQRALQHPILTYLVAGEILLIHRTKQLTPTSGGETSDEISALILLSVQDYLVRVQNATEKALTIFCNEEVWMSDCQPILQLLPQITLPPFFQIQFTLPLMASPIYSITLKLQYINGQKDKVFELIQTFMQSQNRRTAQKRKEIKNILNTLTSEVKNLQTHISSQEIQSLDLIDGYNMSLQQQKELIRYVGDLKALREGRTYEQLTNRFVELGVQSQKDTQVGPEDILERFRKMPLHAIFLYTSEDHEIYNYIIKHWNALDDLTDNVCDFHPILNQFSNIKNENGYAYLKQLDVVQQSGFQAYSHLPAIFFHDNHGASEYISLNASTSEADIKKILRVIFEEISQQPTIPAVTHAKQLMLDKNLQLTRPINENETQGVINHPIPPSSEYTSLIDALKELPTGDGKGYEELVKRVLNLCFADEFASFHLKEQVKTHNQKRIRDFIIDNRDSKITFWRDLKIRRGVEKILFDAKNYRNKVNYTEISSTTRYLKNKAFGNFLIIISRQGVKDWEEFVEDYGDEEKIILFLSDDDLITIIERKQKGEYASSLIEEKYYQFLDMK